MPKVEQGSRTINSPEVIKEQLKKVEARSKAFPWWEMLTKSISGNSELKKEEPISKNLGSQSTKEAEWDLRDGPLLMP